MVNTNTGRTHLFHLKSNLHLNIMKGGNNIMTNNMRIR